MPVPVTPKVKAGNASGGRRLRLSCPEEAEHGPSPKVSTMSCILMWSGPKHGEGPRRHSPSCEVCGITGVGDVVVAVGSCDEPLSCTVRGETVHRRRAGSVFRALCCARLGSWDVFKGHPGSVPFHGLKGFLSRHVMFRPFSCARCEAVYFGRGVRSREQAKLAKRPHFTRSFCPFS